MIEVTCDRCEVKIKERRGYVIGGERVDLCEKCGRGLNAIEKNCEANRQLALKRWLREG